MALLFREIRARVSAAINICFSSEVSATPYQISSILLKFGAFPVYAAQEGSFRDENARFKVSEKNLDYYFYIFHERC